MEPPYGLLVRGVDSLFQKSLQRAVPQLEELMADPAEVLAGGPIVIGPWRRYGTGVLVGVALGTLFLVLPLGLLEVFLSEKPGRQPNDPSFDPALLWALLVMAWVGGIGVMMGAYPGGWLVLTTEGVELRHEKRVVFCPWDLFHTTGRPFVPESFRFVLPIAPGAIPRVEVRRGERVVARGRRVDTPQFKFLSDSEIELGALYEVNPREIGSLLLSLGGVLGQNYRAESLPSQSPPPTVAPAPQAARKEPRGWITISLTRLVLPSSRQVSDPENASGYENRTGPRMPLCCGCGTLTRKRQLFSLAPNVVLSFPVCAACSRACHLKELLWALLGCVLLCGGPLLVGALLSLWHHDNMRLLVPIVFAVPGFVLGMFLGREVGRRRAALVAFKRYSPDRGTVMVWFRRPEYGDRMLAAMNDMANR